jgi:hypothetical protein
MGLLYWGKPEKIRSTESHREMHSADGAPPGTYVPNMPEADQYKWKAKRIGGTDPRIEIRKTTEGKKVIRDRCWHCTEGRAQVSIVARPDGTILMSMNGKALFDTSELEQVLAEIRGVYLTSG